MSDEQDDRRFTGGDIIDMRQLTEARRHRFGVDTRRKKPDAALKPTPEPGVPLQPETQSAEDGEPQE